MDQVAAKLAYASGGFVNPSGVQDFIAKYAAADMRSVYAEFSRNAVTQSVIRALRDLALRPANVASAEDCAVQYGVAIGLGLAAQFLEDPSAVFPALFGAGQARPAEPQGPSYSSTVDQFIDSLLDEDDNGNH